MTINEEVKVHTSILDELEIHVDVATEGLVEEAKHADSVRKQESNCYWYICLVLEAVILIILLVAYAITSAKA